jgi:hypothetical protein
VTVPPGAVTAASIVLHEAGCSLPGCEHTAADVHRGDLELATNMTEAAAPGIAAAERERAAGLEQLADSVLQAFVRTSDGYRARAGGVQIRKWEAALLELRQDDGTYTGGATVDEGYRDEKRRDATS